MRWVLAACCIAMAYLLPLRAQDGPEMLAQQAFGLFRGPLVERQTALDVLARSGRADAGAIAKSW